MSSLRKKTDHELITDFQDGDLNALETLILRHKEKMYTSILFLVKDKYLAEDIFQDVLIKIIDTIRGGRYTEEGKFLPWAMRIAHNLCVDHFRKVKRTPAIKTSDDRDIFEVINFTEDGADQSPRRSGGRRADDRFLGSLRSSFRIYQLRRLRRHGRRPGSVQGIDVAA